jgi:hypothetical protein
VSLVIIILEFVAVFVLQRCRRIPSCSRVLSTSFILSDAAGACTFAVHQITIFIVGIKNDVIFNSRILTVGAMLTVSWASVATMSLERVIALKMNIKYNLNSSKLRIYLIISLIWSVNIVVVVAAIVMGFYFHCVSENATCDLWEATKAGRFVMMGLLIFYEIVLVISYVIIHGIASTHAKNIIAPQMTSFEQAHNNPESLTRRQYKATLAIIKIVFAFMLLHAPIVIHLIIFETQPYLQNDRIRRLFHALSYFCIQINSFVSVRLYVAKIDECKLTFYLMLSRIMKKYENEAESLRVKVYDIVVSSKSEFVGRQLKLTEIPTSVTDVPETNTC